MKRAIFVAAFMLAGCGPGTTSTRSVIVYWDFLRHVQTADGNARYDAGDPGGTADAACAQSDVHRVTITDESGRVVNPELPSVPCVYAGVQGVQINFVRRGTHTWTLTGYRADGVATFLGTKTFTVGGDTVVEATLEGIPDDLDVNAAFYGPRGAFLASTCAAANVGFLAYSLYDGAGTLVATGDLACPNPPGLTFRTASGTGIDRDTYTIRFQAFSTATSADPVFDDQTTLLVPQCQASSFDHHGSDTGGRGWNVALYDVSNPAQALCR